MSTTKYKLMLYSLQLDEERGKSGELEKRFQQVHNLMIHLVNKF